MQEIGTFAHNFTSNGRPMVIAQLNTNDSAVREAASRAGLQTGGTVPRGRYDAALRARYRVDEGSTDSFRQTDIDNVRLAKQLAVQVTQAFGHPHVPVRQEAADRYTAHVGILYGPQYTYGKPSGAGTLKSSHCLASDDDAYAKGFDDLPNVDGLDEALASDATSVVRNGNRLFIVNLRADQVSVAASALGAFLADRQPAALLVSGPEQKSVDGIDVALCVGQVFSSSFARLGCGATGSGGSAPEVN